MRQERSPARREIDRDPEPFRRRTREPEFSIDASIFFVWAAREVTAAPHSASEGDFSAQGWAHGGLNFLAVSEIPAADLDRFAAEFRKRTEN
jgi:hypothetical protein